MDRKLLRPGARAPRAVTVGVGKVNCAADDKGKGGRCKGVWETAGWRRLDACHLHALSAFSTKSFLYQSEFLFRRVQSAGLLAKLS